MMRTLILTAAVLFAALPVLAQECPGCPGSAEPECGEKACEATATTKVESAWAKQIAELEAKAAKGDQGAEAALAAACEDCGTECRKTMAAKVVKIEAAATKGDVAAKNKLTRMKWDMVFAAVRVEPLSQQVEFYSKACDNGCEVSKQAMSVLMKETGAKDRADLTAKLIELEGKAAKGCGECKTKIASMRAQLAPKKSAPTMALSARIEKLAVKAKAGDEVAQQRLAAIAASIESKPDTLVADLKAYEAKAGKGCQDCVAKLAKVEAAMGCSSKAACADCTKGCDDCGDCDGKKDCDGQKDCDGTKSCPSETKPVNQ